MEFNNDQEVPVHNDLPLYQEALAGMEVLYNTLVQNRTPEDAYVKNLYQKCTSSLTTLKVISQNPLFTASFETLLDTLSLHENLLKTQKEKCLLANLDAANSLYQNGDKSLSLDDRKSSRESLIEDMAVTENGAASLNGFDDVIGLDEAKMLLKEACIFPMKYSQLFTGPLQPWSRILLYGPPGTGKTKLARALAAELKCPFYWASSASLLSSWVGESEKLITDLFQKARRKEDHCVIFIDEIDSLCRQRTQTEDEHSRRVKTELLRQLDSSADEFSGGKRIFVLAATNCPWDIDCAFLRRFQRRILISIPHKNERREILKSFFNSGGIFMNEGDWETIAQETEGFSGSDLCHLAMTASFKPIRELHTARFWNFIKGGKIAPCSNDTLGAMQYTLDKLPPERVTTRAIEVKDFLDAIKSTSKTISNDLLQKYEEFAKLN